MRLRSPFVLLPLLLVHSCLAMLTGQIQAPQTVRPPALSPLPSDASTLPPPKSLERQAPFPGSDFPPWQDALVDRIGWRLSQAVEELGSPLSVWPSRGGQAFQDSVVFYYPDNIYLYFWDDRIWQIRLDKRYRGKAFGIMMGQSLGAVKKILGNPGEDGKVWIRYRLPDRGWPVELLLYFEKDSLSDIYLRRGDF